MVARSLKTTKKKRDPEREKVNKIAAHILATLERMPSALPSDYDHEEALEGSSWTYTNMLYHAISNAKAAMKLYVKHRGDPATFRTAKRQKEIDGGVKFYLVPNPAYLDEDD